MRRCDSSPWRMLPCRARAKPLGVLAEVDPLGGRWPSRQRKKPDKYGFVYLYTSQIAIPRGGIICAKKPNKTNTQIGSGHFLCLSVYPFKKNTFLAPPDQTNTQKNSREQKKASHRDLCICVSAYRSKKITALKTVNCDNVTQ